MMLLKSAFSLVGLSAYLYVVVNIDEAVELEYSKFLSTLECDVPAEADLDFRTGWLNAHYLEIVSDVLENQEWFFSQNLISMTFLWIIGPELRTCIKRSTNVKLLRYQRK